MSVLYISSDRKGADELVSHFSALDISFTVVDSLSAVTLECGSLKYTVVVLDIDSQRFDGFSFLKDCGDSCVKIPVIFFTNICYGSIREDSIRKGAFAVCDRTDLNDFIEKINAASAIYRERCSGGYNENQ